MESNSPESEGVLCLLVHCVQPHPHHLTNLVSCSCVLVLRGKTKKIGMVAFSSFYFLESKNVNRIYDLFIITLVGCADHSLTDLS